MRKVWGLVLLGLSVFFLVTALVGWVYAPGSTQRTPLNVNSQTDLTGTATYLGTGPAAVTAQSRNVTNGEKSDGKVAVWTSNTCLWWSAKATTCPNADTADSGLISASTDAFATDRHTGLAVSEQKYGTGSDAHEGLVNKWPFNTERKTYPYWDGVLNQAVDAKYEGQTKIDGLTVYQFHVDIQDEQAEIASGVQGTYSDDKTLLVEPTSGSIIKQSEKQTRTLDSGDSALELELAFTDAQVNKNVKDAKANVSKLSLVSKLPWVALVLALISGVGAAIALRSQPAPVEGRRGRTAAPAPDPTDAADDTRPRALDQIQQDQEQRSGSTGQV